MDWNNWWTAITAFNASIRRYSNSIKFHSFKFNYHTERSADCLCSRIRSTAHTNMLPPFVTLLHRRSMICHLNVASQMDNKWTVRVVFHSFTTTLIVGRGVTTIHIYIYQRRRRRRWLEEQQQPQEGYSGLELSCPRRARLGSFNHPKFCLF